MTDKLVMQNEIDRLDNMVRVLEERLAEKDAKWMDLFFYFNDNFPAEMKDYLDARADRQMKNGILNKKGE